ncbi:GH17932 [Drosophila grimshawi]|uniref:GH17932 n=1 Tax=Drosophila grimshawi TaxID=7222 RepID=B4JSK7_DROGR|nr:GH17932 [Drosophila grimshawi]
MDLQFFQKASGYQPWLYKFTIDVCRFFRKAYNPVAIMVYKVFKDFSNFNHTCPYKGELIIDGLYLRYDKIPVRWPAGNFMLQLKWGVDKQILLTEKFYFYVIEDF